VPGQQIASNRRVAFSSFAYLAIFALLIAGLYAAIGRPPSRRQIAAWFLALVALVPLHGGGSALVAEYRRAQDGRVVSGTVAEKLRPEPGPPPRPRGRRWQTGMRLVSEIPDAIARLIATGSPRTWVVEYRYDCGGAVCRGRDTVSERIWSSLAVGDGVAVRPAGGHTDTPRLDANSPWPMAIARLSLAALLLLGAWLASERRSAPRYVTAPAVVTAVDPIDYGKAVRWRIQFAYFAPDGTALESADEVIAEGVRPGDECIAVYPPDRPDLGTLRLPPHTASSAV
jgi:hypothetical protein